MGTRIIDTSILSVDQKSAWDKIKEGKNLFVTARAGAGKSFLIDFIKENYGPVLVTASTGIAANNVGGRTLHSQFLISTSKPDARDSAERVACSKRGYILRSAKALIIDEISMVSDTLLRCVSDICKLVRRSNKPFGGLQVLLFGDFLQLPPVFKGDSVYDTLCLNCDVWKEADIETVLMTTNFRQRDDLTFFKILTRLRYNHLTQDDIRVLQSRELPPPESAIRLYSLNAEVDRLNMMQFNKLDPRTEHSYEAEIWGEDKSRVEAFKRDTLFELDLRLRVGARVMMLLNEDTPDGYLFNGALGTVESFFNGFPIVRFDSGILRIIEQRSVSITEKDELGRVHELVHCNQVPLRLAYACSIHKSQGQTFDQVSVDCSSVFLDGQVYVALSRARTLDGLFITGFNPLRARSNPLIAKWYEVLEQEAYEKSLEEEIL